MNRILGIVQLTKSISYRLSTYLHSQLGAQDYNVPNEPMQIDK